MCKLSFQCLWELVLLRGFNKYHIPDCVCVCVLLSHSLPTRCKYPHTHTHTHTPREGDREGKLIRDIGKPPMNTLLIPKQHTAQTQTSANCMSTHFTTYISHSLLCMECVCVWSTSTDWL